MKTVLRFLVKIVNGLSYLTGGIAALAIVAAAFITTEGVVVRKLFGLSTIWQIEASVYLLMYACFVGAAFAQMGEHHLNVDFLLIHLSARSREKMLIAVSVGACIVCAVIAWFAWPMWWEAFIRDDHTESLWGPPLWIPYFFIPFGMTLLFLQYLIYIGNKIHLLRKGLITEDAVRFELREIKIPAEQK